MSQGLLADHPSKPPSVNVDQSLGLYYLLLLHYPLFLQLAELGKLRAEVNRLNALGKYIALQGNINIDKFMLQTDPAIGGSNGVKGCFS